MTDSDEQGRDKEHYAKYAASPNDSDSVKELRIWLKRVDELFVSLEATRLVDQKRIEAGARSMYAREDDLEGQLYIARQLLRAWKKATERDFTSDERHALNRLTDRLLDGV